MVARCPQRVHSSMWPPRAAVRQRAMASRTLIWVQRIHRRLRSMKAVPAVRTRSATSKGGRLIYLSDCDLLFSTSEARGLAGGWGGGLGKGGEMGGFFLFWCPHKDFKGCGGGPAFP